MVIKYKRTHESLSLKQLYMWNDPYKQKQPELLFMKQRMMGISVYWP